MNDRQDCCGNWERPSERWQERVCDAVMGNDRPGPMGQLPGTVRVHAAREEKGADRAEWGREALPGQSGTAGASRARSVPTRRHRPDRPRR